jgi:hypothetical protein
LPSEAPLNSLTALQQLRELRFHGEALFDPQHAQMLPTGLTKLDITWESDTQLNAANVPGLTRLTAMQHLDLHLPNSWISTVGAVPDSCSSMQQLRVLNINGQLGSDTMNVLADIVPGLQQLQSLVVFNEDWNSPGMPVDGMSRYGDLLRGASQLTRLELVSNHAPMLGAGCAPFLFPAGRQLPQLKQLVLGIPMHTYRFCEDAYGPLSM